MATIQDSAADLAPKHDHRGRAALRQRLTTRRRMVLAALATAGAVAAGTGALASAGGFAVSTNANGVVMNDLSKVVNVYDGRIVSNDELKDLNREGKATAGLASAELTCQGIMLYVDTDAEAQAYGAGLKERQRKYAEQTKGLPVSSDPCDAYRDSPSFVPEGVHLPAASAGQAKQDTDR